MLTISEVDMKTTTLKAIKREFRIKDDTPLYFEKQEGKIIIMPYSEEIISRIKEKIKNRTGLLPEEMDIAANVGLINRHQFANWTPKKQKEWKEMEQEYKRGEYKEFSSIKEFHEDLDELE